MYKQKDKYLKLHFLELELVCSPDVEIEVAKFNVLGKE
jgi:hypothetical protein